MIEMSTLENEALVNRVYSQAQQDRSEGRDLARPDLVLYEVEMLVQEVNCGTSFEQYFRWAAPAEIARAAERLEALGLVEPARLTRDAIHIAFPYGLPDSEADMDDLGGWSREQDRHLRELAGEFARHNGAITNALAAFYRKSLS